MAAFFQTSDTDLAQKATEAMSFQWSEEKDMP